MPDDENWKLQRHKNRVESLERSNDSMFDTVRTMRSYSDPVPQALIDHMRETRRIIGEMLKAATADLELAEMGAGESDEEGSE